MSRHAKTTHGLIRYGKDRVVAVIDSTLAGKRVLEVMPELERDAPIVGAMHEALSLSPTSILVGLAPAGGRLPAEWMDALRAAADAGLEIGRGRLGLHRRRLGAARPRGGYRRAGPDPGRGPGLLGTPGIFRSHARPPARLVSGLPHSLRRCGRGRGHHPGRSPSRSSARGAALRRGRRPRQAGAGRRGQRQHGWARGRRSRGPTRRHSRRNRPADGGPLPGLGRPVLEAVLAAPKTSAVGF
jgi:hypothetical protein